MKFKVMNIEELIALAKRSEDLQNSYDRLKSNYDKVYNENVQIKHKLGWQHDYEKENEELKKATRELEERNKELYLEDIRIKKEKMTEGNQNVLLKVENEKLETKIKELNFSIEDIKKANDVLYTQNVALKNELVNAKNERDIYQNRCNAYHKQLQDTQKKVGALKEDNTALRVIILKEH